MSLNPIRVACACLLAWGLSLPVHAQDPSAVNPPAPELDYYYPEAGTPGYAALPSASGYVPFDPWGTRLRYRSDVGSGPGWNESFHSIDGFLPIVFEPDRSLLFLDGRASLTDFGKFNASVGAGLRFYSPSVDRVFGGSFWYDYDDGNNTNYDQWGISIESLGKHLDFRLNAYVPSNDNTSVISRSFTNNIRFVQNNIGLDYRVLSETALRGGDFEVGGGLPMLGDFGIRNYLGGYYFQGSGVETTVGFKARSEFLVTEDVTLGVGVSSDKLFGENIYGSVTVQLPDGRPQRVLSREPVRERLYAATMRNNRVNVHRRNELETVKAINPDTGLPYIVHHVDNGALPGGDGHVTRPFNDLSDPNVVLTPDIIFVHSNATDGAGNPILAGYDGGIILNDNQRLLGQGIEHLFEEATLGTLILPGNNGGPTPTITNFAGDVVTLANNNEVSGFNIGGPAGSGNEPLLSGITGFGITDFNINRNVIEGSGFGGIQLLNAEGVGTISDNIIVDSVAEGILVSNDTVGPLELIVSGNDVQNNLSGIAIRGTTSDILVDVFDNTVDNNLDTGIELLAANGANVDAVVNSNTANGNGGNGILATSDGATMLLNLTNNSANNNGNNGLALTTLNAGLLATSISDNGFSSNAADGVNALADSGQIDFLNLEFNVLNSNGEQGIDLLADNGGILNGTIDSNTMRLNGAGGLSVALDNGGQALLTISNNTLADNTGFGMAFDSQNTGIFNAIVNNNQIDGTVGTGILMTATGNSQVALLLDSNQVTDSQGIGFDADITDSLSEIFALGNTFDNSQDAGMRLSYRGATNATQILDSNTITDTTDNAATVTPIGQGLIVSLHGAGTIPTLNSQINNNTIGRNVGGGILIDQNNGSSNMTLNDIDGNNLFENGFDAIDILLSNGSTSNTNILNNEIITQQNGVTGQHGVFVNLQGSSIMNMIIDNNLIDGSSDGTTFSTGHGLSINMQQDSTLAGLISNNEIRQNGLDGINIGPDALDTVQAFRATQGTSTTNLTIANNIIEQNQDDGIAIGVSQVTEGISGFTGTANYTITGNTIQNNGTVVAGVRSGEGVDFEVANGEANLIMTNNLIADNAADGVLLRNSMRAAIEDGINVPAILLLDPGPKSILNATLDNNEILRNGNRGVAIRFEDTTANAQGQGIGGLGDITLTNNTISGNNDEGVYVLTRSQRDDTLFNSDFSVFVDETDPFNDPSAVAVRHPSGATFPDYFIDFADPRIYADLRFTAVGNTISNNGGGNPASALNGLVNGDGMFLLVGTGSYVRADVRDNVFFGNYLDDFRTDSFVANDETPLSEYDTPADGTTRVFLDKISLLDLRFTGNTGNSVGGTNASSDSNRDVGGTLVQGRYRDEDPDQDAPQVKVKFSNRRTDYFRVEDTPTPVGSVLNGTNSFNAADSVAPRNNFITGGYVIAPIGSLFP